MVSTPSDWPITICVLGLTRLVGNSHYEERPIGPRSHLSFSRCDVDQAVFVKRNGVGGLTVIAVHVDDCSILASNCQLSEDFKVSFNKHVEISDLGPLRWFLGIQVHRDREQRMLSLSQASYIDAIIRRYGFEDLKPLSTPMDPAVTLSTTD